MSHFDVLETSGLSTLSIKHPPPVHTSQREFRRPRGEQGPRWIHTYRMSVEMKSYSISTLHSLNSLLGSANLRHLAGDGGGELTDLSVGSAENRARNASSSKLGDGQHCSFFELFPPRVIMKRPPIGWIGLFARHHVYSFAKK